MPMKLISELQASVERLKELGNSMEHLIKHEFQHCDEPDELYDEFVKVGWILFRVREAYAAALDRRMSREAYIAELYRSEAAKDPHPVEGENFAIGGDDDDIPF